MSLLQSCNWLGADVLAHEIVSARAKVCCNDSAVEVVTDSALRGGPSTSTDASDVYTYAEIEGMANALALRLRSVLGCAADEEPKVVLLVEEGVGLVVCELGVLKAGAAFVPVDPNWPPERLAFIVRDCCARAVLLPRVASIALRQKLATAGLILTELTQDPATRKHAKCNDTDVVALVWEDVLADMQCANMQRDTDMQTAPLPPVRGAARRGQRCSHVIYTSGTSGNPKGVVCEHAGLVAYMHAKCTAHAVLPYPTPGEQEEPWEEEEGGGGPRPSRVLMTAAATWDPSLGDIFSTLAGGAVLCLAPRGALMSHLLLVLKASRATHVLTTPALWDLLGPLPSPRDVPNLQVLALVGAALPRR